VNLNTYRCCDCCNKFGEIILHARADLVKRNILVGGLFFRCKECYKKIRSPADYVEMNEEEYKVYEIMKS
jgi:hypothetical protein